MSEIPGIPRHIIYPHDPRRIYYNPELGQWGQVASTALSIGSKFFGGLFGKSGAEKRAKKIAGAISGGQKMYHDAYSSPASLKAFIDKACVTSNPGGGTGYVYGRDGVYAAYKVAQDLSANFPGLPPLENCSDQAIVYGKAGDPCAPYPKWLNTFYQAVCQRRSEIYPILDQVLAGGETGSLTVPGGPTIKPNILCMPGYILNADGSRCIDPTQTLPATLPGKYGETPTAGPAPYSPPIITGGGSPVPSWWGTATPTTQEGQVIQAGLGGNGNMMPLLLAAGGLMLLAMPSRKREYRRRPRNKRKKAR